MTKRSAEHVEMALRLLEAARREEAGTGDDAAQLYAVLVGRLAPLIGNAGFQAVFTRSVKLTKLEFPCFEEMSVDVAIEIDTARCQKRLLGCLSPLPPSQALDAAVALYGSVLALLESLVGDRLVRQVLRRAFPTVDQSTSKETK